jgi:integrase
MSMSRKIGPMRVCPFKRGGLETGKWYLDIPASLTSTGKRTRRFFDNQRKAFDIATRLARELEMRAYGLDATFRPSGLSFSQAVDQWKVDEEARVRTRKKRQISLDTDAARLKSAVGFFGEEDLSFITEKRIVDFQAWRLDKKRSAETVNCDVKSVLKVLKWAHRAKRIRELPKVEPISAEQKRFKPLSDQELVRLIKACPPRLRLLVWFLAETGCRTGEVFHLTWDDVDLRKGVIAIRSKGEWTPKTRQSVRDVYVGTGLLKAIKKLQRPSVYVFAGRKPNQPLNNIKKAFATAVKKAGLEPGTGFARLTPHSLRKAYATRQAMLGTPSRVLQANLGHSAGSRVTEQYYVFATDDARKKAVLPLPVPKSLAITGNRSKKQPPAVSAA